MTEFVQITTTTGSRHEAEQVAAELVSRRLAGCVQISGPITSTYRWQGKIETSDEWTCTVKTSSAKAGDVHEAIAALHSYDIPEIITTPIVGGNEKYLKWLGEQLES